MSLIIASHDSLPYIESAPTADESSTIAALIDRELPPSSSASPHPSLPPAPASRFTPALEAELARIARGEPMVGGVDLSRYDPPSAPTTAAADEWKATLRSAYTSSVHLSARLTNLSLLSEHGRNAWLVHNAQLEDVLRGLEEELMAARTEVEVVNKERKGAQTEVEPALRRLEERWKRAVGRVLEVELATEALRRELLEKQRAAGVGGAV